MIKVIKEKEKNKTEEEEIENEEEDDEVEDEENEEEDEDEDEAEEEDEDEEEDMIIYNADGFPENEDEMLDQNELMDMLGNNMKFNIIFTVGNPGEEGGMYNPMERPYGYLMDEEDDEEDEDYNPEDEEEDEEDDEEDEEIVEEKKSSKKPRRSKRLEKLKKKKLDDLTEEEWDELARDQEKQLRKSGDYYSTKYKKKDKVLVKLKGWDDFKEGVVQNINKNKVPRNVTYDIKLNKKYKGKTLWKKIRSRKIKKLDTEENAMEQINELIKISKKKGNKAMEKKFEEMCKALEKKEKKKQKIKDEKEKDSNYIKLRKLLNQRNVMNDFKFFRNMKLIDQKKILTKLQEVNDFTKVEKPYRIALLESDIPVEFKSNALRKINVLEYMDPGSGEYYKIKQWVDTFMRIPFNRHNSLPVSIKDGPEKCQEFIQNAKQILDDAVYGLNDAKMQILQMIGQWISNPDSLGTAIAIKGPPGTGKTTLIKEGVSKILNRPFAFLALGGATDSSFLEGHSYTYEGSSWGKIVDILINCKSMNPLIYFDELDKISDTPKGEEIVGILTHLTDTTQNDKFHDKYFSSIDFNLSKAMFIFSYNEENKVNPILKDRMYRIKTDGYGNKDKCVIAHDHLIPKIEKNVNFEKDQIIIPDETITYISDNLTEKEKGVRNLKRCLEIIFTKLNLYRLMKEGTVLFDKKESLNVEFPFTVTREIVDKLIKKTEDRSYLSHLYI